MPVTSIRWSGCRQLFQRNTLEDFWGELDAMIRAALLHGSDDDGRYRLSERGMFFADTVAGLLAWMRVNEL